MERRGGTELLVCTLQHVAGAVCLSLTGEVDLATVSLLQVHLKTAAETAENLIVDLSDLRYIDASGIKALVDAHQTLTRTRRRMVLAAVSPMIQRIFTVVGLDQLLPVFSTVEAALGEDPAAGRPD